MRCAVVIPALNEEQALPRLLAALFAVQRRLGTPERVVVVDNGSEDGTARVAAEAGAEVVHQPARGYGNACLAGFALLAADPPDVVVILDADLSDDPEQLPRLVAPIAAGEADMVLGERVTLGERGSLTPQQRVGNHVATALILLMTGHRYKDMGPFRAIRWSALDVLEMSDPAYGWNVEMQMKAVRRGLRVVELAVPYRDRVAGRSKVSGSLRGSVKAGVGMMRACWRHR